VIGGGWAWSGDAPAMPLPQVISLLVRCAGGDGNLALGAGPNGDGVFLPDHKKRLLEMGKWLKKNGESIYGTHGGPYIPGIWGASTYRDNTVYLHVLASWHGILTLPALPAEIKSAEVLSGGKAEFLQTPENLVIKMDPAQIDQIDTLIKLTLDKTASKIAPIKTLKTQLSIGAKASASSERSPDRSAQNAVAADATEFSEGIYVKKSWSPGAKATLPWLQLTTKEPVTVSQIKLMEGRFGSSSRVQKYAIEAKVDNNWKTVHTGGSIGGDCNILLAAPVTGDSFRLQIIKWDGHMNLNSFELY
jgi:alpha-L-fucosidase